MRYLKTLAFSAVIVAGWMIVSSAFAGQADSESARLDRGKLGKFAWAVSVERSEGREGAGPHGGQRPFLSVAVLEPSVGGTYVLRESGLGAGIPGYLQARRAPLFVTSSGFEKDGAVGITVVGMVFATAASRLKVTQDDGSVQMMRLRRLNGMQARKARLARLPYLAFAVRGAWCVRELVVLNAEGRALWASEQGQCPERST